MTTAKQMAERNSEDLDNLAVTVKGMAERMERHGDALAGVRVRLEKLGRRITDGQTLVDATFGEALEGVNGRAAEASSRVDKLEEQMGRQVDEVEAGLESAKKTLGIRLAKASSESEAALGNAKSVGHRVSNLEDLVLPEVEHRLDVLEDSELADRRQRAVAEKVDQEQAERNDCFASGAALGALAMAAIATVIALSL